jgi:hypothetical protein
MFLNITMLAGIAGAAVPLVLHLLHRARYRSVSWGAMMFLDGPDPRQRQSTRLKQWILLAMRMGLVGLLSVALARPLLAQNLGPLGQKTSLTAVILLDRSGSMGLLENGHTRTEQADDVVRQILGTLHRGDDVALIPIGDATPGLTPPATPDLQSVSDELSSVYLRQAGTGVTDMADGLRRAADAFDRSRSASRELFVVCDRQALNWRNVDAKFAAAWKSRLSIPGPMPRIFVVPVGGWDAGNLAIDSISVPMTTIVVNQRVDVEVTIHNYAATARTAIPLALRVSDRPVAATTANIPAGASATVRVPIRIPVTGSHVITARMDLGGLALVHEMSCVVDVVNPIGVLIVSGDVHQAGVNTQADFLKAALMPFAAAGTAGTDVGNVQVVQVSDPRWSEIDSRKTPVVILADVPELTAAQAKALEQHVYGGGALIVAPGKLTRTENFNSLLFRDGAGVLPASLRPATAVDGSQATAILGVDLTHPLFSFLRSKPDPIPAAAIGRYFPATPRQPDARVLASYTSGDPFLVEGDFGRGRVLLFTTALDADWGTLPLTNFYLPLVQSAVRFLVSRPSRDLQPGEPIVAMVDEGGAVPQGYVNINTAVPSRAPLNFRPSGAQFEARFTDTWRPGVYTVVTRRQSLNFVVSPPREEADLTPLTAQRWSQLGDMLGFQLVETGQTPLASVMGPDRSPQELWPMLLAAVLLLGVSELAIAKWWSE